MVIIFTVSGRRQDGEVHDDDGGDVEGVRMLLLLVPPPNVMFAYFTCSYNSLPQTDGKFLGWRKEGAMQ